MPENKIVDVKEVVSDSPTSIQFAIAIRDIIVSTIPGYPECLQCNLTLSVFNYNPYSHDFSFLADIESAMKQIEYYDSRRSFQYPKGVREYMDIKAYKKPRDLKTTFDLSSSEPFLYYIAPLLDGEIHEGRRTINMYLEGGGKEDKLSREFIFLPPENWLRKVTDHDDFKRINMEYSITDISPEDVDKASLDAEKIIREAMLDVQDILLELGYTREVFNYVFRTIRGFIDKIYKVITLQLLARRIDIYEQQLKNAELEVVKMPFNMPYRNPILKKDEPVTIKQFRATFEKLCGGKCKKIIDKISEQLENIIISIYGKSSKYKVDIIENEHTVITGISASVSNKLATIPLLNYSLPTFQFMGRSNWGVNINIQTCDKRFIKTLRSLSDKANKSRINRHQTGRVRWINKLNSIYFDPNSTKPGNGFFKLLGVNYALFDSFVYDSIKEKPGWFNVTIKLVQSDLDLFLYETLYRVNYFDDKVIMDVISAIKKKYKYTWTGKDENTPYLNDYVYPNIRNYIYRIALNVFYGGELDVPPIPEWNTKDLKLENVYIITDEEVTKLVNNGLTNADLRKLMTDKFNMFKAASVDKKIINIPMGKHINSQDFNSRLNARLTSIIGLSKITLGDDAIWKSIEYYLRISALRLLLVASNEVRIILDKGYTRKNLFPQWNMKQKLSNTEYDLYSNYLDLNLPSYVGGVLSTPADFFYKRSDDILSIDFLKEKINKTHDTYMNAWKFQNMNGILLYNKIKDKLPMTFNCSIEDINAAKKELKEMEDYRRSKFFPGGASVERILLKRIAESKIQISKMKEMSKSIQEHDYQAIIDAAKKYIDYWDEYKKEFEQLTIEDKQTLVSNTLMYDIRQVTGIVSCLRLGQVQRDIEKQEAISKKKGIEGVPLSSSILYQLRQEYIAQVDMCMRSSSEELNGTVTPYSLAKNEDIFNRVKDNYYMYRAKDKTYSMERAYPTIKLYFIEEDSNQWGAFDDYYVYNAIENIEVIYSKNSASSMANITVSNISQNLTDPYSIKIKEAPLKEGSSEEQSLSSLYLREGITIMIKAGFDNNSANLDTIFMGKIISATNQDRITIVAQGFGAELLEPVNKGIPYKLGYNSAARTHGDVVLWALNTISGLEHFGSPNAFERLGLIDTHAGNQYYSAQKWRAWDYLRNIHPILDVYFKLAVYDPRFENIYLPYSKIAMSPWNQNLANMAVGGAKDLSNLLSLQMGIGLVIAAAIVTVTAVTLPVTAIPAAILAMGFFKYSVLSVGFAGVSYYFHCLIASAISKGDNNLLFMNSTFDWITKDNIDCWHLLNEIALYHDDYIVTILPYNDMIPGQTRSTLYVGPRDGLYKATDMFDSKETAKKMRDDISIKRKAMTVSLTRGERANLIKKQEKYKKIIAKVEKNKILDWGEYSNAKKQYEEISNLLSYVDRYAPEFAERPDMHMTAEEERQKVKNIEGKFESTGIMWSIDNPSDLITEQKIEGNIVKAPKYDGYTYVTNYHYVDSYSHIINNNIRSSSEDVYNHVVVKYPGDPTFNQTSEYQFKEFWADDNIKGGNIRTIVSEQNNIDPLSVPGWSQDLEHWKEFRKKFSSRKLYGGLPRVYQVGYNILANHMRPMYRGEITVIGMPYVRPYDILFVNDTYNKMWGPIEVETVKHRFSEDGFTTEITPNAVITYMNPGKVAELGFMNGLRLPIPGIMSADIVNWKVLTSFTEASTAVAIALGLVSAPTWLTAIPAIGAIARYKVGLSLWNWGVATFMGRDVINLVGLWKNNRPMVAGMEGAYKDSIQVHMLDKVMNLLDFDRNLEGEL